MDYSRTNSTSTGLTEHALHYVQVPDKLCYLELALDVENLTEQKAKMPCALVHLPFILNNGSID